MTFSQIKRRVLDLLDDRKGTYFDRTYLARIVNEAYLDVVGDIDRLNIPIGITSTKTISVTDAAREYAIADDNGNPARRVFDVVRFTNNREEPLDVVPYDMRNELEMATKHPDSVYIRQGTDGLFYVGGIDQEPNAQTWKVYFAAEPARLGSENSVPIHVPRLHHHVIAYRAALIVKIEVNRDPGGLPALYKDGLDRMVGTIRRRGMGHKVREWV